MTDARDPGWCDCIGTTARTPADHAADCPKWEPHRRGPGSTAEARERAMAAIRAAINRAREGHR